MATLRQYSYYLEDVDVAEDYKDRLLVGDVSLVGSAGRCKECGGRSLHIAHSQVFRIV
jgi:hypothetical protein